MGVTLPTLTYSSSDSNTHPIGGSCSVCWKEFIDGENASTVCITIAPLIGLKKTPTLSVKLAESAFKNHFLNTNWKWLGVWYREP